ncbi:MAG TPA: alpha/beta hydrolase [Thermoanaerobaculia bacterium]|nr:alpha/beta hydrolase [Thermoanaerobaculia bacterium]
MIKLLLFVLAGWVALAAFAALTADRQIFLPPRSSYRQGELPVHLIPVGDGVRIAALHLPNPEADFTIVFSHGNAEDLGHLAPLLAEIRDAGFGVVGWDYRGYGLSSGGPATARNVTSDVEAIYRWATGELGIPPAAIVPYGRSVGSGPATHLAAREPVGGLVIESGFTSAFRVVTRVPLLPFDRFPNLREIRNVRCPVLVIHGIRDRIIPLSHGKALHAAAPGPKQALWVPGAGHNDLHAVAGDTWNKALEEFRGLLEDSAVRP